MGQKKNPKSQENHRPAAAFLQIPLCQISKTASQTNIFRVPHRALVRGEASWTRPSKTRVIRSAGDPASIEK